MPETTKLPRDTADAMFFLAVRGFDFSDACLADCDLRNSTFEACRFTNAESLAR